MNFGYYCCAACGSKIRVDKWEKHCETKRHVKFQEKSIYAKEIFNSSFMTKITLLCTFIPRIKFEEGSYRTVKE